MSDIELQRRLIVKPSALATSGAPALVGARPAWSPMNEERALSLLERANRTPISPKLLGEAMEAIANMSPKRRAASAARIAHLMQMLTDKGFIGRRHDLAIAINYRLRAIAQFVQGGPTKGWTLLGQEQRRIYLHEDLLRAAAKAYLIKDERGFVTFDAANFTRRMGGRR